MKYGAFIFEIRCKIYYMPDSSDEKGGRDIYTVTSL